MVPFRLQGCFNISYLKKELLLAYKCDNASSILIDSKGEEMRKSRFPVRLGRVVPAQGSPRLANGAGHERGGVEVLDINPHLVSYSISVIDYESLKVLIAFTFKTRRVPFFDFSADGNLLAYSNSNLVHIVHIP